jgi:hypothetical protein
MSKIAIANLYKVCSLRARNLGQSPWTASDNCGQIASTAVKTPDGVLYWRCGAHAGIISAVFGEVVTEIEDERSSVPYSQYMQQRFSGHEEAGRKSEEPHGPGNPAGPWSRDDKRYN